VSIEREALVECCLRLASTEHHAKQMEQLVAQGLAASQRGERLGMQWQRRAESALRLLREDESNRAEA
jgi:hypothetical protein